MATVDVTVNGRHHIVQCGEGEEVRVRRLASYIDKRVADLAKGQAQGGDTRLLLMASLLIADELSDALDEIKRLQTRRRSAGAGGRAELGGGGRARRAAARCHCSAAGEGLTSLPGGCCLVR